MRVVYTAGVWDLLHEGHLSIIERSARLGDHLIVGVVSDEGARAYKGRLPVVPESRRLAQIRALRWVDAAVIQPTTDPSPVVRLLRPHVMTHGDDWRRLREGNETLEELGIELVLLPYTAGVSSSMLRCTLGV